MKDIYRLELLEETFQEKAPHSTVQQSVQRVPGGWIFSKYLDSREGDGNVQERVSSVFVPYNNEFKQKEQYL